MRLAHRHPWVVAVPEATEIQRALAARVIERDDLGAVARVAGVDVGFEDGGATARAAVAVLSFPALEPLEQALARRPVTFPYVPGYLSFREVPVVIEALDRLARLPDLILCDGQGRAHPRRFGLACHLGVLTGLATVGVAKTRLTGEYREPGLRRGSRRSLRDRGEVVGTVLRTRSGVKPVFVSVGHRVSLASAVAYTLACCTRYRLPETTRHAHRLASH